MAPGTSWCRSRGVITAVRSGWLFRPSAQSFRLSIARSSRARYFSSGRQRSSGICRRANTHARLAHESEDRRCLSSASAASAGRLIVASGACSLLATWQPSLESRWAATALPECGVRAWLSPEDHGDPYDTTHPSIRIFLNRSYKDDGLRRSLSDIVPSLNALTGR